MSSHQQHVLFSIKKNIGFIKLNRPEAFNALNPGMMASIRQRLLKWQDQSDVHGVIVHAMGDKAFCAGGDLKAVYNAGMKKQFEALDNLFREEYLLTHVIKTFPKPYMSFVDGIVMGGGMGLSVHGSHCLVSEKTIAAMPETAIGFFPDVGASSFLNRAPGSIGLYLGLTGSHIEASDALYANMGTHYIPHEAQAALLKEIKSLKHKTHDTLDAVIDSYAQTPPTSTLEEKATEIEALFGANTLEDIFQNLTTASSPFAKATLEKLHKASPTSLAITFEQLKRSKALENFKDIMSMEFDLSQQFVRQPDFFEGIRAALIQKDHTPQWSRKTGQEISQKEVDSYFEKAPIPLF